MANFNLKLLILLVENGAAGDGPARRVLIEENRDSYINQILNLSRCAIGVSPPGDIGVSHPWPFLGHICHVS